MPKEIYPDSTYPPYISGYCHLFAEYVVKTLLKSIDSYQGYVLFVEDAFITGIIAQKANIARYNSPLLSSKIMPNCNKPCDLAHNAIMIGCDSNEKLIKLWPNWIRTKASCIN